VMTSWSLAWYDPLGRETRLEEAHVSLKLELLVKLQGARKEPAG
jgi:hypothetical protein